MKKIRIYTENLAPESFWLNHLVHPVRAFWGDGTDDWPKWEKDFLFYKDYFEITFDINESDIGFLPLTLNYYIKNNLLSQVDELASILKIRNKKLIVWIDGDHPVRYIIQIVFSFDILGKNLKTNKMNLYNQGI